MVGKKTKNLIITLCCLCCLVNILITDCWAVFDFSKIPNLQNVIEEKNRKMDSILSSSHVLNRYTYECDDSTLRKRYEELSKEKWLNYFINAEDYGKKRVMGIYKPEYKVPDNWKVKLQTRHDYPYAFEYNLAKDDYNASFIVSERNCFLAIEAPSSKNIDSFIGLMNKYEISHFVRLNSPDEYGEDYYPFWEKYKTDDENSLNFGKNDIKFFRYLWPHKKEGNPNEICKLFKEIYSDDTNKLIAVSCRAGAGRTATFIAAYMLLDEVNYQLNDGIALEDIDVSVDKVVWNILIQRPFSIAFCDQYINLYRVLDCYLSDLMS